MAAAKAEAEVAAMALLTELDEEKVTSSAANSKKSKKKKKKKKGKKEEDVADQLPSLESPSTDKDD